MSLSSAICKAATLILLLNPAVGYAAANDSLAKELKTQLFNVHNRVKSFVREKMQGKLERLRSESADPQKIEELDVALKTPQDMHRSTRKFLNRMMRKSSFLKEEEDRKRVVHLMYIAIQEHEQLSPKDFKEQYEIYPGQLEEPKGESLERLHALLLKTKLWQDKDTLLKGCEEEFKDGRYAQ